MNKKHCGASVTLPCLLFILWRDGKVVRMSHLSCLFLEVAVQQALEGTSVASLVACHFVHCVVDGI